MVLDFLLVWCSLGDAFNGKRNFAKLAWNFREQEIEKGLEGCSIVFVLDIVEGKELEEPLKIWNFQNKQVNSLLWALFRNGSNHM